MSKFKQLGLDDLRQHGVNAESALIVNAIDKHIEDTVMHLLHLLYISDDVQLVSRLEEEKEFNGVKWRSTVHINDMSWVLVEDSDIFLSLDFEVYGHYEQDGEFDYAEVNITKLNLNWIKESYSLIGTDVEVLIDKMILEWI